MGISDSPNSEMDQGKLVKQLPSRIKLSLVDRERYSTRQANRCPESNPEELAPFQPVARQCVLQLGAMVSMLVNPVVSRCCDVQAAKLAKKLQ